jgi:S-DNA-T family DNA segregation ATPase FtsK/SpoIIIE
MKSIRIVLTPTRSRPLNVLLGLALISVATLLFVILASYHSSDPSFDTSTADATAAATRNLLGVFGAYLADLLLQTFGLSAYLPSFLLAALGIRWLRSRSGGSFPLRVVGSIVALVFLPTLFALLPWHLLWMHLLPLGGVIGSLNAAWMLARIGHGWTITATLLMTIVGIYFAAALSWRAMLDGAKNLYDRYEAWQQERAERLSLREEEEPLQEVGSPYSSSELDFSEPPRKERGRMLSFFRREPKPDELQETPAYDSPRMMGIVGAERRSVWERTLEDYNTTPQPAAAAPEHIAEVTRQPLTNYTPAVFETPVPPAQPTYTQRPAAPLRFASEIVDEPAQTAPIPDTPAPLPFAFAHADEEVHVSAELAQPITHPAPAFTPLAPQSFTPQPPQSFTQQPQHAPQSFSLLPQPAYTPQPIENITVHDRADAHIRTSTRKSQSVSGYKLPSTNLLTIGTGPQIVREEELREEALVLKEKCAEFGVMGQVVRINPGPMVTTYEFKPEAGVKYSRVTGLSDDLCLAMRAESILIERMAGQSTVGIQVPNHERETIHLRECLESEPFQKAKSKLTIAMGKDINGRMHIADLAAMPHVLIAGSTGSGKSVAINAMIMSLLYRTTPQQVRLILVDPKRVELGMYEGIPHLFTPIITEPKLAANALRNAVSEMQRRYKLLASRSVRNIDQYNKLFDEGAPSLFDNPEEQPLPYIVIIIDELADLMMLDRTNVEESITRLAQMARAVGIHLVLATQRPSVDVITGLIKANVPTRISFRLATKVDSRTILDTNGAESLLGRGDMLFMPPGTSRHTRLHAPYVSEKETAAVVEFWKQQGKAEYVEGFLEAPRDERAEVEGSADGEDENDPMYDEAVKLVYESGKASTSLMQRRLRIGYGRAAHLIDLMERDGLVGPADGSRPRELLKPQGWLNEVTASAIGD